VTVRATLGTAEMQPAYPSQIDIWAAAGEADYVAVASQTGEPLLTSMSNFGTSSGTSEAGVYIRDTDVSVFELFQIQKRRAMLRKEYLDYWQSTKSSTSTGRPVDAIISPVAPSPPTPHGKNRRGSILSFTQTQL